MKTKRYLSLNHEMCERAVLEAFDKKWFRRDYLATAEKYGGVSRAQLSSAARVNDWNPRLEAVNGIALEMEQRIEDLLDGETDDLSKINVAVGQKLKPGDLIGVEGSTGHSTGSHLHWEIRINDISTGYVSVHQYAGIPNVAGSTAYTSNWAAELFGPSTLKKSTSGFPQRLYNSVLQGALGIDKDGIFGANTEKTVKEFQSAHGLTADGIAGAKTKVALAKQL